MTNIVDEIQFRYDMNKALKEGKNFDQLFAMSGFAKRFAQFHASRIGQIWLKTSEGWEYRIWQS